MIYQVGGTKEAREQLDSWLKERQDYLVMIAKYRRKIHAIDEELEELNNTKLKAFRPPTPKVCSRIWQTVKRWFTNEAPKIKLEDVQQAYDGYTAVTDAIEKINHTNTNINIRPFG